MNNTTQQSKEEWKNQEPIQSNLTLKQQWASPNDKRGKFHSA